MRSAAKFSDNTLPLAVLLLALHAQAGAQMEAQEGAPTQEQVQKALEQVRNDPLWSQKKKERVLRFKPKKADKPKEATKPADITEWINSIADAARYLIWGLSLVCVAWALVALRRWARLRDQALPAALEALPSHISALDIRPQSLPAQIGEAVLRLWQDGQHRQALSLLYRGTLSRLVHQHAVPIKAASTEEECVALAGTRLDIERGAFVQQLITVWQHATYGSQLPGTDTLEQLCQGFACLLDQPAQEVQT